ncbi:peptidoglycan hydrolase-like protein with peptidoglycan-binding domain [Rhodanobacter sp. K2T2]|uniref:peptidoglycan-binding domain-containing protein n=1 Tax=Rhodanobacter sp. K2T2 TaxID=2723085 RepID=UPI0015CC4D0B|nr:peptidoglycan-binding domain-containing protein [Rhodanobacter sp. K2T2]NYE28504.1 peptidoglycan hydrolase-like protein with peptidoglycan-binding domain [Rhodanobacter sp. K2T2]
MADRRDNAVATANAYNQGNIAGLDDAMTRRLVASTVLTESNGGDLAITNRQGYVGRYQAGAGWLADAGYIDQNKLHDAMKGYRSEWAWASDGGMTKFLDNPTNWKNGLSLEKYKASADLQDGAFKINSDKAYRQAVTNGVLKEGDDPAKVAGFLKARHIAGYGGAVAAVKGGRVIRDSNGTSNYDYMHDITRNRDRLSQWMNHDVKLPAQRAQSTPHGVLTQGDHAADVSTLQTNLAKLGYKDGHGQPLQADGHFGIDTRHAVERFQHDHGLTVDGVAGTKTLDAIHHAQAKHVPPDLTDPKNPDHALYEQARMAVHKLDASMGRVPDLQSDQLAASLVVVAKREGMTAIDTVVLSEDGSHAFAVQARPDSPLRQIAFVPTAEAVNTPLDKSSAAAQAVHQEPVQTPPPITAPVQSAPGMAR